MSEEESVLDKRQEWDFIVAGWPSAIVRSMTIHLLPFR